MDVFQKVKIYFLTGLEDFNNKRKKGNVNFFYLLLNSRLVTFILVQFNFTPKKSSILCL